MDYHLPNFVEDRFPVDLTKRYIFVRMEAFPEERLFWKSIRMWVVGSNPFPFDRHKPHERKGKSHYRNSVDTMNLRSRKGHKAYSDSIATSCIL